MSVISTTGFRCHVCGRPCEAGLTECPACGTPIISFQASVEKSLEDALSCRQRGKFDLAKDIYNKILTEYADDTTINFQQVYWGLYLCEENVMFELKSNGETVPSFAHINSGTSDEAKRAYFEAKDHTCADDAIKLAELKERIDDAKVLYQKVISSRPPYDIFICFKKTSTIEDDAKGDFGKQSSSVTNDYNVAKKLYKVLSQDFDVFFSEKELSKLPTTEYEPYIYHALYTSKLMILICSRRDYIESKWLKNEWGRFSSINKNVGARRLIPIFIDGFRAEELPEELLSAQGYTYSPSKIGELISEEITPALLQSFSDPQEKNQYIDKYTNKIKDEVKKFIPSKKKLTSWSKMIDYLGK